MARAVKEATVAELTERFASSDGAVLTEYRGLTVSQVGELRQSLGENATFSVVKNTLTRIAAKDAGVDENFSQLLAGPSAIAFVRGDIVQAAKGLRDFAKANPFLVIKGGIVDGRIVSPAEISKLADLESRFSELRPVGSFEEAERIVLKGVKFEDVGPWIDQLATMRRAVCRIEPQPESDTIEGYGTGFLVAPDVVIRVARRAVAGRVGPAGPAQAEELAPRE